MQKQTQIFCEHHAKVVECGNNVSPAQRFHCIRWTKWEKDQDSVSLSLLKHLFELCGYSLCVKAETLVAFKEIRVGRPDGFNVTTSL